MVYMGVCTLEDTVVYYTLEDMVVGKVLDTVLDILEDEDAVVEDVVVEVAVVVDALVVEVALVVEMVVVAVVVSVDLD